MRNPTVPFLLLSLFLNVGDLLASESEGPFREIPRHFANDLEETFFNPWHQVGLAAGIGLMAGIHEADTEIQEEFHPADPLGGAKDVFNLIGNSFVLGGSAVAAQVISRWARAPRATVTTEAMVEALILTYAFTFPVKFMAQRLRPDGSNRRSFPSAHASGSFALATVVEILHGPLYGVPSYALAGAIALARLDANKHFASDTAGGALLGTLIGLGTAKFHKKERPDLFVVPMVELRLGLSVGGTF